VISVFIIVRNSVELGFLDVNCALCSNPICLSLSLVCSICLFVLWLLVIFISAKRVYSGDQL